MKQREFKDFEIKEFGNTRQIAGLIYDGHDETVIVMLPNEDLGDPVLVVPMLDDWEDLVRQTDLMETEVLKRENGKQVKVVVRKCERQIDTRIMWQVFQRDNYSCRYCGRTGLPLTVDHIVLWEDGGPTEQVNLNSSCKKCNRTRGNMQYKDWLNDPYYLRVSKNLSDEVKGLNTAMLKVIKSVKKRMNKRSR